MSAADLDLPIFLLGCVVGLFGWSIYSLGVQAIGTTMGAATGIIFATVAVELAELKDSSAMTAMGVAGVLGGVGGWWLMNKVQKWFFFLIGALLGGPLAWTMMHAEPLASAEWARGGASQALGAIGGAIAGGIVFVLAKRYVIALVTSVVGAVIVAASFTRSEHQLYIGLFAFVLSAGAQFGIVWKLISREKKKEKK